LEFPRFFRRIKDKTTKEGATLYARKIAAYFALEDRSGREAQHTHLSSDELEAAWRCTANLSYAFMA
jgi:hypothetical protein